ncbi:MAG: hypothetical protein HQL22_06910 [Candidatus Omnitrophica bacterium]|nr:hypothetical protein [Candidatus Omnitrophota bacterium]
MGVRITKKIISSIMLVMFIMTSVMPAHAQGLFLGVGAGVLPEPGSMVQPSQASAPILLKGLRVDFHDPFRMDFYVDGGDDLWTSDQLKSGSQQQIKYFLAGLAIPDKDLWVNLSPYEKDRITSDHLGVTELGRDMLAQDYILKQLTASLTYPDSETGKSFWAKAYSAAYQVYGTTDVPIDTFNKVWIVPGHATVVEKNGTAFVTELELNVFLDKDYQAQKETASTGNQEKTSTGAEDAVSRDVARKVLLPIIKQDVNHGRQFERIRQIFYALILAKWYKDRFKEGFLGSSYIGKNKVTGIDIEDVKLKEKIFEQYVQTFRKGVYNFIREDVDPLTKETVPRKYFSGGVVATAEALDHATEVVSPRQGDLEKAQGGLGKNGLRRLSVGFGVPGAAVERKEAKSPVKQDVGAASSSSQGAKSRDFAIKLVNGQQPAVGNTRASEEWAAVYGRRFQYRAADAVVRMHMDHTIGSREKYTNTYGLIEKVLDRLWLSEGITVTAPRVFIVEDSRVDMRFNAEDRVIFLSTGLLQFLKGLRQGIAEDDLAWVLSGVIARDWQVSSKVINVDGTPVQKEITQDAVNDDADKLAVNILNKAGYSVAVVMDVVQGLIQRERDIRASNEQRAVVFEEGESANVQEYKAKSERYKRLQETCEAFIGGVDGRDATKLVQLPGVISGLEELLTQENATRLAPGSYIHDEKRGLAVFRYLLKLKQDGLSVSDGIVNLQESGILPSGEHRPEEIKGNVARIVKDIMAGGKKLYEKEVDRVKYTAHGIRTSDPRKEMPIADGYLRIGFNTVDKILEYRNRYFLESNGAHLTIDQREELSSELAGVLERDLNHQAYQGDEQAVIGRLLKIDEWDDRISYLRQSPQKFKQESVYQEVLADLRQDSRLTEDQRQYFELQLNVLFGFSEKNQALPLANNLDKLLSVATFVPYFKDFNEYLIERIHQLHKEVVTRGDSLQPYFDRILTLYDSIEVMTKNNSAYIHDLPVSSTVEGNFYLKVLLDYLPASVYRHDLSDTLRERLVKDGLLIAENKEDREGGALATWEFSSVTESSLRDRMASLSYQEAEIGDVVAIFRLKQGIPFSFENSSKIFKRQPRQYRLSESAIFPTMMRLTLQYLREIGKTRRIDVNKEKESGALYFIGQLIKGDSYSGSNQSKKYANFFGLDQGAFGYQRFISEDFSNLGFGNTFSESLDIIFSIIKEAKMHSVHFSPWLSTLQKKYLDRASPEEALRYAREFCEFMRKNDFYEFSASRLVESLLFKNVFGIQQGRVQNPVQRERMARQLLDGLTIPLTDQEKAVLLDAPDIVLVHLFFADLRAFPDSQDIISQIANFGPREKEAEFLVARLIQKHRAEDLKSNKIAKRYLDLMLRVIIKGQAVYYRIPNNPNQQISTQVETLHTYQVIEYLINAMNGGEFVLERVSFDEGVHQIVAVLPEGEIRDVVLHAYFLKVKVAPIFEKNGVEFKEEWINGENPRAGEFSSAWFMKAGGRASKIIKNDMMYWGAEDKEEIRHALELILPHMVFNESGGLTSLYNVLTGSYRRDGVLAEWATVRHALPVRGQNEYENYVRKEHIKIDGLSAIAKKVASGQGSAFEQALISVLDPKEQEFLRAYQKGQVVPRELIGKVVRHLNDRRHLFKEWWKNPAYFQLSGVDDNLLVNELKRNGLVYGLIFDRLKDSVKYLGEDALNSVYTMADLKGILEKYLPEGLSWDDFVRYIKAEVASGHQIREEMKTHGVVNDEGDLNLSDVGILADYLNFLIMSASPGLIDIGFEPFKYHEIGRAESFIDLYSADMLRDELEEHLDSGDSADAKIAAIEKLFPYASKTRDRYVEKLFNVMQGDLSKVNLDQMQRLSRMAKGDELRDKVRLIAIQMEVDLLGGRIDFQKELRLIVGERDANGELIKAADGKPTYEGYFPERGAFRDGLLRNLKRRSVSNREQLRQVQQFMSFDFSIQLNKEVSKREQNKVDIRSMLAEESAEAKRDILYWMMGLAEKPDAIKDIELRFQASLDYLKEYDALHTALYNDVGREVRLELLRDLLVGESRGIINVDSVKNQEVDKDTGVPRAIGFVQGLFDRMMRDFDIDQGKPESKRLMAMVKTIFSVLGKEPREQLKILSQVILALDNLKKSPEFSTATSEQKIAHLSRVFFESSGFLGIKIAQYLGTSMSFGLSKDFKDILLKLTKDAEGIDMEAIFSILEAVGEGNLEIEKILAAASVKTAVQIKGLDDILYMFKNLSVFYDAKKNLGVFREIVDALVSGKYNDGQPLVFREQGNELVDELTMIVDEEVRFDIEKDNNRRLAVNQQGRSDKIAASEGDPTIQTVGRFRSMLSLLLGGDVINRYRIRPPVMRGGVVKNVLMKVERFKGVALVDYKGADRDTIYMLLLLELMEQVFVDGFYHADLHPGNVIVTKNEDGTVEIGLIDLGKMNYINVPNVLSASETRAILRLDDSDARKTEIMKYYKLNEGGTQLLRIATIMSDNEVSQLERTLLDAGVEDEKGKLLDLMSKLLAGQDIRDNVAGLRFETQKFLDKISYLFSPLQGYAGLINGLRSVKPVESVGKTDVAKAVVDTVEILTDRLSAKTERVVLQRDAVLKLRSVASLIGFISKIPFVGNQVLAILGVDFPNRIANVQKHLNELALTGGQAWELKLDLTPDEQEVWKQFAKMGGKIGEGVGIAEARSVLSVWAAFFKPEAMQKALQSLLAKIESGIESLAEDSLPELEAMAVRGEEARKFMETVPLAENLLYRGQGLKPVKAFAASNEVAYYERDPEDDVQKQNADIFLGYGSNNVIDEALRRNAKSVVVAEISEHVLKTMELLYKSLVMAASTPAEFLSFLSGVPLPANIIEAQDAFSEISHRRSRVSKQERMAFADQVSKLVRSRMAAHLGADREGEAETYAKYVYHYLVSRIDDDTSGKNEEEDLYTYFKVRYFRNVDLLRQRAREYEAFYQSSSEGEDPKESQDARVDRFLKNWRHEKFSFLSSLSSFEWLKDRFSTDNVKYILTDINDPQAAYKEVGKYFGPGRSVNAVSFSNIIDVELSEDPQWKTDENRRGRPGVSGVYILKAGDSVKNQTGYLLRFRKHVHDIEMNLSTKGGLTVSTTRLLLEPSGQARYNHVVEGLSGAVGALTGNSGIHIVNDSIDVIEGKFWQGIRATQKGKLQYESGDIEQASRLSGETIDEAMSSTETKNVNDLGGIDFSQIKYDLKLDAEGVPVSTADWRKTAMNLPGLVPVIYGIVPVELGDVFAFSLK